MKPLLWITTFATLSTLASASGATDCTKWQDHAPGYCGVLSNDKVCAVASNRVAGKCNIPAARFYVDASKNLIDNSAQAVMASAGTYALLNPDGSAVSLVASGGGNLVASGAGNLVAQGAGNIAGQRSLFSAGGKKVFILKR